MLFRYVSKLANGVLILFARFGSISAKNLLKFLAIESVLVMNLLLKLILFGNFCCRGESLSIASFITDHIIFVLFSCGRGAVGVSEEGVDFLLDDGFLVFSMGTRLCKCNFYNATKYRYIIITA